MLPIPNSLNPLELWEMSQRRLCPKVFDNIIFVSDLLAVLNVTTLKANN